MPNSVDVLEVRIPVDRICALTKEQRYAYYLLGLIYNELMALRKLISFCLQQASGDDSRRARMEAEMSHVWLLFRVACAKAWEAQVKLNSREISRVLTADVFPEWPEGPELRKEMNRVVASATWLAAMRNALGFHYPSIDQWAPYTTPNATWEDDLLFLGSQTGNTFYDAAEAVAKHHMFDQPGTGGAGKSNQLVDEMINLLGVMTDYVETALGMLVVTLLVDVLPDGPRHKLSAPKFQDVRVPFWTEMTEHKRRKRERLDRGSGRGGD